MRRGKLLRANKRWGRCSVPGHGRWCEVSQDIQGTSISREEEKRGYQAEIEDELREAIEEAKDIRERSQVTEDTLSCHGVPDGH